jgi:ion channel
VEAGKNNEYREPKACGLVSFGLPYRSSTNGWAKHFRPRRAEPMIFVRQASSAVVLWESAFYFSAASYATVGYGDVVLPQMWRTLGPVESIIGVLMCGLSASFLFAIVSRLVDRETKLSREHAKAHTSYIEGETIPTI